MFIHVVQSGDSLFSISNGYGISVEQLRGVNGIEVPMLVPGQALLIPLYTYTVQPGDSLYSIAKRAFVSLEQLGAANPSVSPSSLQPGMNLTIPDLSNYPASLLSYYVFRNPELDALLVNDFAPYSSYISMFDYHFGPNGDILNTPSDLVAVEEAWENRVTPLATITNLTPYGFSTELAHHILNSPTSRGNLINNIAYLMSRKGYGGVNIDFERVATEDRDLYTGFLSELKTRLDQDGYVLTVAVHAKTSEDIPWLQGYDYAGIGSVVDLMFVMAYDWHHAASEPGPVAPINEVRNAIEFSLSNVPRDKIILGIPLYGYDWSIPYTPGTEAFALSNESAIDTAMRYQSPIQYSEQFATPYYRYSDENDQRHEVWFEDVRSIGEKMKLVRDYNLQGLGAWQLTLGFPAGPWLLRNFFTIKKV